MRRTRCQRSRHLAARRTHRVGDARRTRSRTRRRRCPGPRPWRARARLAARGERTRPHPQDHRRYTLSDIDAALRRVFYHRRRPRRRPVVRPRRRFDVGGPQRRKGAPAASPPALAQIPPRTTTSASSSTSTPRDSLGTATAPEGTRAAETLARRLNDPSVVFAGVDARMARAASEPILPSLRRDVPAATAYARPRRARRRDVQLPTPISIRVTSSTLGWRTSFTTPRRIPNRHLDEEAATAVARVRRGADAPRRGAATLERAPAASAPWIAYAADDAVVSLWTRGDNTRGTLRVTCRSPIGPRARRDARATRGSRRARPPTSPRRSSRRRRRCGRNFGRFATLVVEPRRDARGGGYRHTDRADPRATRRREARRAGGGDDDASRG